MEIQQDSEGRITSIHILGMESYFFTYDSAGSEITEVLTLPNGGASNFSRRLSHEWAETGQGPADLSRPNDIHGGRGQGRSLLTACGACQLGVFAYCVGTEPFVAKKVLKNVIKNAFTAVKWVKRGGIQALWSRTVKLAQDAQKQYKFWNKKFAEYKKTGQVKLSQQALAKASKFLKDSRKYVKDAANKKDQLDNFIDESAQALQKLAADYAASVLDECRGEADFLCDAPCFVFEAIGWGDPHMITFDGLSYDCQAEGEMILMKTLGSDFLEVQGRFTPWSGASYATVTTGLVIKARGMPKIEMSLDSGDVLRYKVNGVEVPVANGDGYEMQAGSTTTLTFPALNVCIQVSHGNRHLSYELTVAKSSLSGETVVGLFGNPNGDPSDDWMMQDGTPLEVADSTNLLFETAYDYCRTNWCIRNASASLFSYLEGESFEGFSQCDKVYDPTIEAALASPPQCVVDACGPDDQECILEGIALGRAGIENAKNVKGATLCLPRSAKACYFSCADALASTCDATSGLYKICANESGPSTTVYCDQEIDGGGWMLLYSYKHLSGENEPVNGNTIPLDPVNGYSHFHLNQLPGYAASAIESVRFFCRTSGHDRVMHFKNAHPVASTIAYSGDSSANYPDVWNDDVCYVSDLPGHTAFLPKSTNYGFVSTSDGFLYFPFFQTGYPAFHWAIASSHLDAARYECDDFLGDSLPEVQSTNTTHNVWVKMKEKCCAFGYGTYTGHVAHYDVTITYDGTGIRTDYPNLQCGNTAPIVPNSTGIGRLEWVEVIDYGSCDSPGDITLVAEHDQVWTYTWRGIHTGPLRFECNRACELA